MRRKEEHRRKFHEALINLLYPPPSTSVPEDNKEDELENILPLPDEIPDVFDDDKSSSDGGDGKLTRAQRKRLRKRKLKEESAPRGKMVGPLLPATDEENDPEGVRRNVSLNPNLRIETDESGGVESCSAKNKVKQRRIARKLAKPMPECDNSEKLNGSKECASF